MTYPLPSLANVRGCIEFRQDSDTADQGVVDNLLDHFGCVNLGGRVTAVLSKLGPCFTDVREALGVGDMPMERVQFGHSHTVDRSQDCLFVNVIPAGVQKNSTIGISWTVHYVYIVRYLNLITQIIKDNQLTECFHSMSSSKIGACCDMDFYLKIIFIKFCYEHIMNTKLQDMH